MSYFSQSFFFPNSILDVGVDGNTFLKGKHGYLAMNGNIARYNIKTEEITV